MISDDEQPMTLMTNQVTTIETLIDFWSMRPQPGTPAGEAWEQGARQGWAWAHDQNIQDNGTQLLEWLAANPDFVLARAPTDGRWQIFSQSLTRAGLPKGISGKTPTEVLTLARIYNFPSVEGYQRYLADHPELKNA